MIFAFGRNDGFYAAFGKQTYWKGVPNELHTRLLKEPLFRALSMGEDGAFFTRHMPDLESNGSYYVSPKTFINYPEVKKIYDSDEVMNWVAFGPDGAYVVDTTKKVYASNKSMVRTYNRDGVTTRVPLRCASFGPMGVWVVVEDDGEVRSEGLPANVKTALAKKPVRKVDLCPTDSSRYFIEYTDGTTDWKLPTEWHPHMADVEKIVVKLDKPADTSIKTVSKHIIFAFGPMKNEFCIINGAGHAEWKGMPDSLQSYLKQSGTVNEVAVGEGGAWFWRRGTEFHVSNATKMAYPEVWKIWKSDEVINWIAFGPCGFYIVDTAKHVYASRQDKLLRTYTESHNRVPLRCASFGYGGSWVVVEDDGIIRSWGINEKIHNALMAGNVRNVQLSKTSPNHFYIEYLGRSSDWSLPGDWHETVKKSEGSMPKPKSP